MLESRDPFAAGILNTHIEVVIVISQFLLRQCDLDQSGVFKLR